MQAETKNVWGDFSRVAHYYDSRPPYSSEVLTCLARFVGCGGTSFRVGEIGAGTGKLTQALLRMGLSGWAVEPNDAMRAQGLQICGADQPIQWLKGSAEATTLPDSSVDWVCVATAFQFAEVDVALREFHRILRPGGQLSLIWNVKDAENPPLENRVEQMLRDKVPDLKRSYRLIEDLMDCVQKSHLFRDCMYLEKSFPVLMPRSQYFDMWQSLHDIPSQVTESDWTQILATVEAELKGIEAVSMRWRTRVWTLQVCED